MAVTIIVGKRTALGGLSLFVLGALIGVGLIAPATSQAVTIYARSASCAGLDFYPTDTETTYNNSGTLRYRTSASLGTGTFRCDPGLPNGAVVTKVQFTLLDNNALYEVSGCNLVGSGLTTSTATSFQQLASVPGTGVGTASSSPVRLTDHVD